MIRTVNLLGHLPPFVQEYREIQAIMDTENPELQLVEDESERIKNNMFVLHTDEVGVQRYEKMFGLMPSKSDTLKQRQANVMTKLTTTVVYTLEGLIERLNVICGVGNYSLELDADRYEIIIHFHLRIQNFTETIHSMMKEMIPANMICTYIIDYNTNETLSQYPQYLLMQFTQKELYTLLIEENISADFDNLANYTMESFESVSCEHMATYGMRKV